MHATYAAIIKFNLSHEWIPFIFSVMRMIFNLFFTLLPGWEAIERYELEKREVEQIEREQFDQEVAILDIF